jgi:thiamine-phosphate pyrophosphorylase
VSQEKLRGLYAITDEKLIPEPAFTTAIEQALSGGASIIQYRDKSVNSSKRLQQAQTLRALCHQYSSILIINDDIDLAKMVAADGVHLGEDDISVEQARRLLGSEAIIGISCYNHIERAIAAQAAGADYVAFGAVFSSPTKPNARPASCELISEAKAQLEIPVCAIGGIDKSNIAAVVDAGADMTAIISGLFAEADIHRTAEHMAKLFD